jgi:hypothetical protein
MIDPIHLGTGGNDTASVMVNVAELLNAPVWNPPMSTLNPPAAGKTPVVTGGVVVEKPKM